MDSRFMAHRRALQPLHHRDLLRVSPFGFFQQSHHMFLSRTGFFFLLHTPVNNLPVNHPYYWIPAEQELIDGHICLNDQSAYQIPWEDQPENHQPPPTLEESSTWYSPDEETAILELDGDYSPTPSNAGFPEETISDHLQRRTHHVLEDQETDICVVCQSEYEENENLGRLRCGHEYHADCIGRWLLLRKFCPVCKHTA